MLEVAVHHPTQFAALARFVHRYDSGLRLYNSDLMLAPMYCWQKGVFPLARVEVEERSGRGWGLGGSARMPQTYASAREGNQAGRGTPMACPYGKSAPSRCCDDEWAVNYALPPLRIMRVRLEGFPMWTRKHGRRGALEVEIDGEWQALDDAEEPVALGFRAPAARPRPGMILSEWGDRRCFRVCCGRRGNWA